MPSLQLEVVSDPQALASHLPFWRAHAPSPMQSPAWLLAWWSAFETPNTQLSVLIVRTAAGEVIGLAPFYLRDHWTDGRTLRFLGSGRACTDFQTLLTTPGREVEVGTFIGQWLIGSQTELNWGMVELEGTQRDDAAISAFVEALKQARCQSYQSQLESTWRLDLTDGWPGFLSRLSRTQRSQTRNLVNRFDKNDGLTLRLVAQSDELPRALQQCIELHQKRWTAVGEPGCFADTRFTKFVELACQNLARDQRIRIALLEDNGVPIACHIYLLDAAGNKYMYQSARDPARHVERIGQILNALEIRQATQEGIAFIDFLRGDEIYKRRSGAVAMDCMRVRIVAPQLIPRVRHGLRVFGRSVKQQVIALRNQWGNVSADEEREPPTAPTEAAATAVDR